MITNQFIRYPGHTPQIYDVSCVQEGFCIIISRKLAEALLDDDNLLPKTRKLLEQGCRTSVGEYIKIVITLPFISLPNFHHKKMFLNEMVQAVVSFTRLLNLLNMFYLGEEGIQEGWRISRFDQGILLGGAIAHNNNAFPIFLVDVAFSQNAREYLKATNLNTDIAPELLECRKTSLEYYLALSTTSRKRREENRRLFIDSVQVRIRRDCTVPHFVVPGDCACLGASPDEFKESGHMYSHNVDTVVQQIAMFAAVISFWERVLKPRLHM